MLSKCSVVKLGPMFSESCQVHFFPGPGETIANGKSSVESRSGCREAARKPLGVRGQGTDDMGPPTSRLVGFWAQNPERVLRPQVHPRSPV